MLFGAARRMRIQDPKTIQRPVDGWKDFGIKLRAGDVNGDDHVDLIEGAPDSDDGATSGHLSFCAGTRSGRPKACVPIGDPNANGTTALAVADVNCDHYDDIVQGDTVATFGVAPAGGAIRIWLGGKRGPRPTPIPVVQGGGRHVPGADEVGDAFGQAVDAGYLDDDGCADIVVSAPGENLSKGALTVIRGGHTGIARTGHAGFAIGLGLPGHPVPGRRLGWSLAVLDLSGDKRPDVATAIRGADNLRESVYVIQAAGKGAFAPDETRAWSLLRDDVVLQHVGIPKMRLGRADGV
jgi:hypothetical protein